MDPNSLTQSPFAALTFVAAPALLTNPSSVLALGTINRMLCTRERMHELFAESKAGVQTDEERKHLTEVTDRVERQAALLLTALHAKLFRAGRVRVGHACDLARRRSCGIARQALGSCVDPVGTGARLFWRWRFGG